MYSPIVMGVIRRQSAGANSHASADKEAPTAGPSPANGADLTPTTLADFHRRLLHDCLGEGVADSLTAEAIFNVEARRLVIGVDTDYTAGLAIMCEDQEWFSLEGYWMGQKEPERQTLDRMMMEKTGVRFLGATDAECWNILDGLAEHTVVGYIETWEFVSTHFTRDAAATFVDREKHDYP